MSQAHYPKISIVTPSYNQGDFIEETITSVLAQQYPNLEYIVIDGGSTDNTLAILKKYDKQITYWVSEPDQGQSDAINKGFAKATGTIFGWLNSDDYLLPKALFHIANANWKPDIGAVVGIGHKVALNKNIVYTPQYYENITTEKLFLWTKGKNFMQPSCFFSKNAWDTCGPLNTELNYCMDVALWIAISKQFKFLRIPQQIAHAYIHEQAKTTADVEQMLMETYLMIASMDGLKTARNLLFDFYNKEQKRLLSTNTLKNTHSIKTLVKAILKKLR
ncbi:glycosyltransferase family 2 protein [Corallibacter sp.]|uniref:glycosyltransferase family 2 protein n=1 Tax=Corallibacter sp. TaxID=2038084 RepID=UPI003AB7B894